MNHIETWEEKRRAFFAGNPKCKECGGGFDHYSRTGICRKCQIIKYRNKARAREPECSRAYRKKHRKRIQAKQAAYYKANREAISQRKKDRYHEQKRNTASYI